MYNRKTHEKYIQEVAELHSNIEVVGLYINANTKILHRCLIDNHKWMTTPNNVLQGNGCPVCTHKIIGSAPEYKNSNGTNISKCCRDITKTAGGYHWQLK